MANVEFIGKQDREPKGVLKRMADLASEVSALRDRLQGFQSKVDGVEPTPNAVPEMGGGLKSSVDRMEMDMRSITRTMATLEELL